MPKDLKVEMDHGEYVAVANTHPGNYCLADFQTCTKIPDPINHDL